MSEDRTVTISKHEVVIDRMFAEDTWELAFGTNAWGNKYTDEDVYHKLTEHEKKARAWDTMYARLLPPDGNDSEDTEENYELRERMDSYLVIDVIPDDGEFEGGEGGVSNG